MPSTSTATSLRKQPAFLCIRFIELITCSVSLPALDDVKGSFNIQSTGDIQGTCDSDFKKLKSSSKIQGPYTCVGKVNNPGGEGTTPTSSADGSKKSGAASADKVQGSVLLAGLAAAMFF